MPSHPASCTSFCLICFLIVLFFLLLLLNLFLNIYQESELCFSQVPLRERLALDGVSGHSQLQLWDNDSDRAGRGVGASAFRDSHSIFLLIPCTRPSATISLAAFPRRIPRCEESFGRRWALSAAWGQPALSAARSGAGRGGRLEPPPTTRVSFLRLSQPGRSSRCRAQSAAAFGTVCDARRVKVSEVKGGSQKAAGERFVQERAQPVAREPSEVKQIFSSKMTLRVLVLCLAYSGLGKADVVPQAGHIKVRMGDNVTLSCALTKRLEVLQVTWQKHSEELLDNIATYSIANGLKIHKPYEDRMNFTSLELNKTSITFWDTRMDDSGCYKCLFNVYPYGSFAGNTCLSVFGLNASVHHNVSEGRLIAICNADGLPEPTITWSNLFNSTPTQKTVKHKNGIVSVTSKLEIYNIQSIRAQDLTCRVSNTNETFELPVKIKGEEGSSLLWLVVIAVLLIVVLVLILIVLSSRKILCRRS